MKMVINGFAGAGTITMGGYDYHTGDRITGELRDLRLSEEQRELIVQSRLLGLSHKQIAEEMGKKEGTVRVALHRALVRLAAVLDEGG